MPFTVWQFWLQHSKDVWHEVPRGLHASSIPGLSPPSELVARATDELGENATNASPNAQSWRSLFMHYKA